MSGFFQILYNTERGVNPDNDNAASPLLAFSLWTL